MSCHPYLDHASLYGRHGLRVFPCARIVSGNDGRSQCSCPRGAECSGPGKHPLQSGWRDQPASIDRWWGLGGAWNVGIITGVASGIIVLDIDPRHGGDKILAALEQEHGALPPTWRFLTGGGGEHILFSHPGGHVANGANVLGHGVDVRGDGGFIVAPPSMHLSGNRYRIAEGFRPDDVTLAPLPGWLHARLIDQRRHRLGRERPTQPWRERPIRPSRGLSHYGEVALDNACRRILDAPPGQQELTINGEAYSIGRLAGAGAVPVEFALRALHFAAQRIASYDSGRPWRGGELAAKVERSFGDGMGNPRRVRR